jgi:hypothetical protein
MPTPTKKTEVVAITAPNIQTVSVKLQGNAPYMQSRFSQKAMLGMMSKMDGSSKAGTKKVREARDFDADFENAKHISEEGWIGIPASSIRAALISACRLVNFTMTRAKLSLFVPAQSYDVVDGQGLIRIYGDPIPNTAAVRNATGVFDIRVRPIWNEWYALADIKFDADQFKLEDVINLLKRVGLQVGLGEGRPDSRASAGLGYGTFDVLPIDEEDEKVPAPKKLATKAKK